MLSSKTREIAFYIFHGLVIAYAALLVALSITIGAAQTRPTAPSEYRLQNLDDRTKVMESLVSGFDHRLTVIETTLQLVEHSTSWNQFTMGGIGLLLARAVYQTVSERIKKGD